MLGGDQCEHKNLPVKFDAGAHLWGRRLEP